MNTYKMIIAYDGTNYGGWQIQKNTTSIQELLEKALFTILRKHFPIIGSGRTDAGVHALAQVAHFKHADTLDTSKILLSLNALLPPDIRILSLTPTAPSFHARFSALSKVYHYYLYLDPVLDPFQRLYSYRPPHPVDSSLLAEAARYFVGTHDFTSFANSRHAPSKGNNCRTIHTIQLLQQGPWHREENKNLCLAFEGNGFLYKMVRNIVGTLLDVCAGKIALDDLPRLFAAQDRRISGRAAPAHGLFLIDVKY